MRTRIDTQLGLINMDGRYVNAAGDTMTGTLIVPTIIGGAATTSDLVLQTTSGVGAAGADMHFLVGNNGAIEAMTILNSGYVGIGTTVPASLLDVSIASASPIVSITNKSDTNTYDPQIAFRTGAAPATRMTIWLDDSDSDKLKISSTTASTYPALTISPTNQIEINILDNNNEAFAIKEATNAYLTFDSTDDAEKMIIGKDLETGLMKIDTNSGAVNFVDMDITSASADGTEQSLSVAIDGNALLKVYVESDGAGGIKNKKAIIEGDIYPATNDTYYLGKNSISTPLAYKGLVLRDITNGNYYRVEMDDGNLVATQIV